jgi:hypothetical protein
MRNPFLFDTRGDDEPLRRFQQRSAVAMELCLTSCKVFRECLALSRVDPTIWGVVAGCVVLNPELAKKGGKKKRAPQGP